MKLFGGLPLVRSFAVGEKLSDAQLAALAMQITEYRKRLFDISWFMRWEPPQHTVPLLRRLGSTP